MALPEITSPVPGSTLSGSTETFQWTPNDTTGIQEWFLRVGSTLGGTEYHNERITDELVLSRQVTTIPTDGSTVYVEFSWKIVGWTTTNLTYTAEGAVVVTSNGITGILAGLF